MNKKIMFTFVFFFSAFLLVGGVFFYFFKIKNNKTQPPYFLLSPSEGKFKSNDLINFKIILNTGGKNVSAAGIIINYEKGVIEPESIFQGKIFSFYLNHKIDKEKGEIKITGLAFDNKLGKPSPPFNGEGEFAQINFRVLPISQKKESKIKIYFLDYGNTLDSNIMEAETAKDILKTVNQARISLLP